MDQFEEFMPDEVEEVETAKLEEALLDEKGEEDADVLEEEDLI
jgi:hypothetical protein